VPEGGRSAEAGSGGGRRPGRVLRLLGVLFAVVLAVGVLVVWTPRGAPEQAAAPGTAPATTAPASTVPPATRQAIGRPASSRPPADRPAARPAASPECSAPGRQRVTSYAGTWRERINDPEPPPDRTYDLRKLRHVGYGSATMYAITIANPASGWTSSRTCVLGGTVTSSVDRDRTWEDLEESYNGDALDVGIESDWAVVDGLRADNVFDAIAAQGPVGTKLIIRNVHLTDIRDDCIENDHDPKSLTVQDSLLDGCFTGISERPDEREDPQPRPGAGAVTTLDGVLLHVKPQAFGTGCEYAEACRDGRAAFNLFKWSPSSTPRVVIRNSVLRVDRYSAWGPSEMVFPPGIRAENSVLVWLGPGRYPAPLPAGMRVTTDRSVWEHARAQWLCRHGRGAC
jgi:hypothetical protein